MQGCSVFVTFFLNKKIHGFLFFIYIGIDKYINFNTIILFNISLKYIYIYIY